MKSVAQTIIEADRFYTIAAKTGSVIQAVESVKDGGNIRLASTSTSPSRSGLSSARRRRLPYPQPRFRQAHRPDDDRHRKRHLAPPVGGRGRHFPDVEDGAHPGRHRPPALHVGCRQVHRHRGHGYCRRRCAPDLAGDCGEDQLWTISEVKDRAKHAPKAEEKPAEVKAEAAAPAEEKPAEEKAAPAAKKTTRKPVAKKTAAKTAASPLGKAEAAPAKPRKSPPRPLLLQSCPQDRHS